MNIDNVFRSEIVTDGERLVFQITEFESLVETNGFYFIKNTEIGLCYRGVDARYDIPQVLELVKRGL